MPMPAQCLCSKMKIAVGTSRSLQGLMMLMTTRTDRDRPTESVFVGRHSKLLILAAALTERRCMPRDRNARSDNAQQIHSTCSQVTNPRHLRFWRRGEQRPIHASVTYPVKTSARLSADTRGIISRRSLSKSKVEERMCDVICMQCVIQLHTLALLELHTLWWTSN